VVFQLVEKPARDPPEVGMRLKPREDLACVFYRLIVPPRGVAPSPESLNPVCVESRIAAHQGEAPRLALGGHEPVEGIAMVKRQRGYGDCMFQFDLQKLDSVPGQLLT